ncbi:glycosyltransferase family 39 protein [Mucilaginibacter paludis]|uniref:4-amino-4-deoxy-L-arabinose transferase and related glycosyltransferase of PMT family n=1 Tax=Mucilaginibacter paludis DSM 18603 TaxID=714943 RepID=H1XZJ6_9SPHI|nr:glycosyltransferase family 39 protein [Mucilaginibacter paludis]EHQ26640.1 4-amino-4-deoxy-L-arabinose transferase and related glycosyltransferase of PMT family [Mucilaginibacter paludis DSM 18603]
MPDNTPLNLHRSNKPIWYFLLFWTVLNAVQSYTLEVHGDEAYYWVYSRFLDWGYFDHPPMVAVFIRIGDSIMHNELGLRLLTVFTNSCSLYLIWLILKKYAVDAKWFILVVSGLFIFHIYGFTTTPDSPLLFFTVLFYFVYQRYVEKDSWQLALLLALITACLLYSKYHGILLIGFTVCSNIKLLGRKSFWLIAMLALALYVPHIYWQVQHGYPSLKYHLFDRSAEQYDPAFTYLYPLGQLAMAGPFIGWFLFYAAFKVKIKDVFMRGLVVNCIGTFLFFMVTTLKGEVQMHWTLIAFVPLLMLVLISFRQSLTPPKWFYTVAVINIVFIVFIRVALLFQFPFVMNVGQLESYFGFRSWTRQVERIVGNNYLIIRDGFQDPSKYNYYSNSARSMSYDSRYYRKTQYDSWPIEDSLQHKRAYYMQDTKEPGFTTDSVIDQYHRRWYTVWVNDVRTYQKVIIEVPKQKLKLSPGQTATFNLTLQNPYSHAITFADSGYTHKALMEACFFQKGDLKLAQKADMGFNRISLLPGAKAGYAFKVTAPAVPGKYDLLFSIRTTPFPGSRNSSVINLVVE